MSVKNVARVLASRERLAGPRASDPSPGPSSAKRALEDWEELDFIRNCSAEYCTFHPGPRSTIALSYNCTGTLLASTHGDHTVKISCAATGKAKRVLTGHRRTPWVVRFHPSRPDLLASGSLDHEVRLWDASTGACLLRYTFGKPIASLAFHGALPLLAIGCGHKVYIWEYGASPVDDDLSFRCGPHTGSEGDEGGDEDDASRLGIASFGVGGPGAKPPTIVLKTRRSMRAVHFHPGGLPLLLTAEVQDAAPTRDLAPALASAGGAWVRRRTPPTAGGGPAAAAAPGPGSAAPGPSASGPGAAASPLPRSGSGDAAPASPMEVVERSLPSAGLAPSRGSAPLPGWAPAVNDEAPPSGEAAAGADPRRAPPSGPDPPRPRLLGLEVQRSSSSHQQAQTGASSPLVARQGSQSGSQPDGDGFSTPANRGIVPPLPFAPRRRHDTANDLPWTPPAAQISGELGPYVGGYATGDVPLPTMGGGTGSHGVGAPPAAAAAAASPRAGSPARPSLAQLPEPMLDVGWELPFPTALTIEGGGVTEAGDRAAGLALATSLDQAAIARARAANGAPVPRDVLFRAGLPPRWREDTAIAGGGPTGLLSTLPQGPPPPQGTFPPALNAPAATLLPQLVAAFSAAAWNVIGEETPPRVRLRAWSFDEARPGAALDPATSLRLEIPHAILCSEMGVHFSPCGTALAAAVACRERSPRERGGADACGGTAAVAGSRRFGRPTPAGTQGRRGSGAAPGAASDPRAAAARRAAPDPGARGAEGDPSPGFPAGGARPPSSPAPPGNPPNGSLMAQAGAAWAARHAAAQAQAASSAGGMSPLPTQDPAEREPPRPERAVFELRVYSLDGADFGCVVRAKSIRAAHCLTSVRFSPTSGHLLLAYGKKHVSLLRSLCVSPSGGVVPLHTILEVVSLADMRTVRALPAAEDEINAALFHPSPGGGIAYGTKEGRLRVIRHDRSAVSARDSARDRGAADVADAAARVLAADAARSDARLSADEAADRRYWAHFAPEPRPNGENSRDPATADDADAPARGGDPAASPPPPRPQRGPRPPRPPPPPGPPPPRRRAPPRGAPSPPPPPAATGGRRPPRPERP